MSHPNDMGPQEEMAVGCFIMAVFFFVFLVVLAIVLSIGYLIYLYTQGVFA